MNLQAKRLRELAGYARTLTREQGPGVMAVRALGFFKRRFFGKRARYWPGKQVLAGIHGGLGQGDLTGHAAVRRRCGE